MMKHWHREKKVEGRTKELNQVDYPKDTDWRRKRADRYSISCVCALLRGWREITSEGDSIGGGFYLKTSVSLITPQKPVLYVGCMHVWIKY